MTTTLELVPTLQKIPRPHQEDATTAVVRGFTHDGLTRQQLIITCAGGKTLIGMWTAQRLKAKTILVTVPTLGLLSQTLREWKEQFGSDFLAFCVCCDATVAKVTPETEDDSSLSPDTYSLAEGISTDPADIKRFLKGPKAKSKTKVIFSTYSSSEALSIGITKPLDFMLIDEAHRTACSKKGLFSTALSDDAVPAKRRLFMTATQRIFYGEGIDYAISMCDEQLYGPVAYHMNYGRARDLGLVAKYRIVVVGIYESEFQKYVDSFPTEVSEVAVEDAAHLAAHVMCVQAMKDFGIRKMISFHNRLYKAKDFASGIKRIEAWMPEDQRLGEPLDTFYLHSKTDIDTRREYLEAFADSPNPSLIANVRCLSEGVDVPAVDAIAYIDPKQSPIEIIQSFGRAVRPDPNNPDKTSYIVIPALIPDGADARQEDMILNSSSFRAVWNVINAMSVMDEELSNLLRIHLHHPRCGQPDAGHDPCGVGEHLGEDPVPQALEPARDHEEQGGPAEPQWQDLVELKIPTEVTNAFCNAMRVKLAHPGWAKCWASKEDHIAVIIEHKAWSERKYKAIQTTPEFRAEHPDFHSFPNRLFGYEGTGSSIFTEAKKQAGEFVEPAEELSELDAVIILRGKKVRNQYEYTALRKDREFRTAHPGLPSHPGRAYGYDTDAKFYAGELYSKTRTELRSMKQKRDSAFKKAAKQADKQAKALEARDGFGSFDHFVEYCLMYDLDAQGYFIHSHVNGLEEWDVKFPEKPEKHYALPDLWDKVRQAIAGIRAAELLEELDGPGPHYGDDF